MLQARIAELEQELRDLKLREDPRLADRVSASNLTPTAPEPFSDGVENLSIFLHQCRVAFDSCPSQFESEKKKVLWASAYLRGSAFRWFKAIYENDVDPRITNFSLFSQALMELHGDPKMVQPNACKLSTLRQTTTVAQYAADFDHLANNLDWGDGGFRDMFYKGLQEKIKDLLMEAQPDTLTYADLKRLALQKDKMLQKRENERALMEAAPYGRESPDGRYGRPQNYSGISRRRGPLTEAERDRRRREGLCLYCGESGHKLDDCSAGRYRGRVQIAATAESGNDPPQ